MCQVVLQSPQAAKTVSYTHLDVYKRQVQVYVKAEHSKMPHGQLKKIVKLPLCAGEEKEINIRLESEAFMLYDENGEKILPSGHFEIFVGGMQPDSRSEKLTGKTVESLML